MLREADVDAVAVCVPNDLHAEVTVASLRAKKHVIVEKPLALTLADADAMIRAARANHRWLMVDQTQRFDPVHRVAQQALARGVIGKVTHCHGRLGHAGPEDWSGVKRSWFIDKRRSGGGALIDVGIHILDLLRWLSGKSVNRLCAHLATREKRVAVEDYAGVLLEFTDGSTGAFEASWTTRPYEMTTAFYGQRGTLRTTMGAVHPVTIQCCDLTGDPNHLRGAEQYLAIPSPRRVQGAYVQFAQDIARRHAPLISGEDARASLEVILAAYRSAQTGRWVELPR